MDKKKLLILLVLTVFMAFLLAGCAKPAPAKGPIKFGVVGFLPQSQDNVMDVQEAFFDKITELSNGEIIFEWRGGPETFSAGDIGTAVQSGVADIGLIFYGAYESVVPGVNAAMLTEITDEEVRKPGGAYDYMQELHKEHGLYYLGKSDHSGPCSFYSIYLYDKAETPEDFAKLILGSAGAGRPAILGWGAAQVMLPPSEFYSAMERHVVGGIAGMPVTSWYDFGGAEITKYVIDHPFYDSASAVIMNLNSFNSLPEDLQNLMAETFIQAEKEIMAMTRVHLVDAKQAMIDDGVEYYKLSPEVSDWYITSAYDKAWELQQEKFPEVTPRLKELFTK